MPRGIDRAVERVMGQGHAPPLRSRAGFVHQGGRGEEEGKAEVGGRERQRQEPLPHIAQDRAASVMLQLIRPRQAPQAASERVRVVLVPARCEDPVEEDPDTGRVDSRLDDPAERAQTPVDGPCHPGGQAGQVPPLEFVPYAAFEDRVVWRGNGRRRRPLEPLPDAELSLPRPRAGAGLRQPVLEETDRDPPRARWRRVSRRVLQCAASSQSTFAFRPAWNGVS